MNLAAAVRSVFPVEPKPSKLVNYMGGGDPQQIVDYFGGKTWPEITMHGLMYEYEGDPFGAMAFMTDEAFRYYLPSFMMISLEEMEIADLVPSNVCWRLTPPDDPAENNIFLTRMSGFSPAQKEVIATYLREDATTGACSSEAREAYEGYWHQFDPAPPDQKTTNAPTPAKP